MRSAAHYFAFIDESGKKEYIHAYNPLYITYPDCIKDRTFWLDNYVAVVALLIASEHIPPVSRAVVEIKKRYFGTTEVEVKSSWLRIPYEREKRYCKAFGVSPEELNEFGKEILSLFTRFRKEITIIACVFDKRYYRNRDKDPFLCAMQVLFERIEYFMKDEKATCTLVIDQLEDSLSIDTGRNGELFEVFIGKRSSGPRFLKSYRHINSIHFRKSKDDHFLQLADIAAYNVFRQFVDHGVLWEREGLEVLPLYEGFRTILGNFRTKHNQLRGWGLCKIPDPFKRRRIKEE